MHVASYLRQSYHLVSAYNSRPGSLIDMPMSGLDVLKFVVIESTGCDTEGKLDGENIISYSVSSTNKVCHRQRHTTAHYKKYHLR